MALDDEATQEWVRSYVDSALKSELAGGQSMTPARSILPQKMRAVNLSGETPSDGQPMIYDATGKLVTFGEITGDGIADDAVNSEHMASGSVDDDHIATDAKVDPQKIHGDYMNVYDGSSGTVSINNASTTNLTSWDTTAYDTDSYWAAGNPGRFTADEEGVYVGMAAVKWAANVNGYRRLDCFYNGTTVIATATVPALPTGGAPLYQQLFIPPIRMAAGIYLQIRGYQNSGGALNINHGAWTSYFSMFKIGDRAPSGG